ncbi:dihydroxyacetone kinase subunit DhaL [Curtobacterium flaccumfaciens]|uniref:dihydroxyacetone kinase subunit DhaL n=1 Tax=Curtobacterium flaccumfaciens TaxID=2035 RepID=UPI001BDEE6CC|nr:dihydroxyacetone kinase subunit DhaL [Curtobacterium flaccumfaciens]MBT1608318.1 dihydroxyacetone kinase subunit L [Curtobacterium flaccumfaciens pv. betae]MBT1655257.1 dihydroxyacetone kinase subunit L [Curtobacterium flaccumfaciens pv. betae]MCS0469664.1 dihydroxyacetone kinase subunit L [Curtobacterium flaccumfaciens pv. betae]MCS0474967.1 dihydroxyacetone kinase subunit L [Curtobacterium flaccumfaciens pv. betae]MCS0476512.1 dihydroxyacetone kinase subunit L [Curtobacterium flaccumfacie
MALDTAWAIDWVRRTAATIDEHRAELVTLDREIGDGDHGENLDRGFRAVLEAVDSGSFDTPGAVLKTVATKLISTVGGAAGPLFGTAYLKAAQAAGDAAELDTDTLVAVLTAARDGVVSRGKAAVGDKTMVDAWSPAVDAAAAAAGAGDDPKAVLTAAADAAARGAADTEPLVAHKGRASYLGDRAIGYRDPGAQSTAYILRAAVDAA